MTVEQYRQRLIQIFHEADCDEFIELVVLPTEKEFRNLEKVLKGFNDYRKKQNE